MSIINNTLTVKNPRAWRIKKKVMDIIQYSYTEELINLAALASRQSKILNAIVEVEKLPEYRVLVDRVTIENKSFLETIK